MKRLLCFVLVTCCLRLEAAEVPLITQCPTAGDERITGVLVPLLKKHDIPAMAVAIVSSRGLEKIGAAGFRKWGSDVPVALDDQWHIGSDTKVMTAALAGRLVEQDKLRWDTRPVDLFTNLVSQFQPGFKEVTLLHLLSHRAGLRENLNWARFAKLGSVQQQRLEAVREAFSEKPKSTPGSEFLYSNVGYVIVGAMIEQVTGTSWEEALRRQIFQPLGMRTAGFGGPGTPDRVDQPWGHTKARKPVKEHGPAADNPPVLGPAGRVHCTLQEWSLFIADQLRGLRGEPALLQPATYQALARPPFGGEYALGWGVVDREWGGGRVFNHCGCNTMYYANAWVAPKKNFAILVCANLGLDAFQATDEAVSQLLGYAGSRDTR